MPDNLGMDSTSLSRILYVDFINSENSPEKHLKLIISNGSTYSAIVNLLRNKYSLKLPGVETKGYVLNINTDSGDNLIKTTSGI